MPGAHVVVADHRSVPSARTGLPWMTPDVLILIADDDGGHARLIQKNLARAGLTNPTRRFEDGQQVFDFFFNGVRRDYR